MNEGAPRLAPNNLMPNQRKIQAAHESANDLMALGAMTMAHERGIALPDQPSIVGFDDIPVARTCWPALTMVRQPLAHYGRAAAAMAIDGAILDGLDLESRLIICGSTAAPRPCRQGSYCKARPWRLS
jgi:DNA-binding LacI/PurR family transcriptional regulator